MLDGCAAILGFLEKLIPMTRIAGDRYCAYMIERYVRRHAYRTSLVRHYEARSMHDE